MQVSGQLAAGIIDEDSTNITTVFHLFCDELFALSSARDCDVKGVMVKAVPGRSADYGDLMDSHTWSVMEQVMSNSVTDVVVLTPSSATYLDAETNCLPALRGASGHVWYGLPG